MSSAGLPLTGLELGPPSQPLVLTAREFAAISSLAREHFGLELGRGKEQLVAARVGRMMRRLGFSRFRELYQHIQGDGSGLALVELIDTLTTNHTGFFRERAHFSFLIEQVFPNWSGPMRIWSTASATGEEPYSIAIVAREHLGAESQNLPRILASDISTRALEAARAGIYKAERFQGAPAPWLRKHLLRGDGRWVGSYRMGPEIQNMIEFRRINLIEPLPDVGRFAVIFCRNVMIYFSRQTQEDLVRRLATRLEPGGYLFVGHSESLTGMKHGLQYVRPAIYRRHGGKT